MQSYKSPSSFSSMKPSSRYSSLKNASLNPSYNDSRKSKTMRVQSMSAPRSQSMRNGALSKNPSISANPSPSYQKDRSSMLEQVFEKKYLYSTMICDLFDVEQTELKLKQASDYLVLSRAEESKIASEKRFGSEFIFYASESLIRLNRMLYASKHLYKAAHKMDCSLVSLIAMIEKIRETEVDSDMQEKIKIEKLCDDLCVILLNHVRPSGKKVEQIVDYSNQMSQQYPDTSDDLQYLVDLKNQLYEEFYEHEEKLIQMNDQIKNLLVKFQE